MHCNFIQLYVVSYFFKQFTNFNKPAAYKVRLIFKKNLLKVSHSIDYKLALKQINVKLLSKLLFSIEIISVSSHNKTNGSPISEQNEIKIVRCPKQCWTLFKTLWNYYTICCHRPFSNSTPQSNLLLQEFDSYQMSINFYAQNRGVCLCLRGTKMDIVVYYVNFEANILLFDSLRHISREYRVMIKGIMIIPSFISIITSKR